MAEALYTIDILRLAASTANWPRLGQPDGSAERRSPTCGSRISIDITLGDDGTVAGIGLAVSACALGQASAAILAAATVGRDAEAILAARTGLADYLAGATDQLPAWPGIEPLAPARGYPARHPSILLAFDATLDAIAAAAPQWSRAHAR